ncbi:hypothetical protein YK56LOC_19710 [Caballeronia sp. HLA56]
MARTAAESFGPQIERAFERTVPRLRYNVVPDGGGVFQTGARRLIRNPDTLEGWDAAERAYDAIRADRADVALISKNTGMSESSIARIKDHVFFNEHRIESVLQRFDADPGIVNSWNRLTVGDWVESDLSLLQHERFESKFESIFETDYRTAHDAAIRSGRIWIAE